MIYIKPEGDIMNEIQDTRLREEPEPVENDLFRVCYGCEYNHPVTWRNHCFKCARYYAEIKMFPDLYEPKDIPEMLYGSHKLLTRKSK